MISLSYQVSKLISLDIGTEDTDSDWLIKNLGMLMFSQIKGSTHRYPRLVLLRKMPSDKSFNWLFPKSLPTNNQTQCHLHNKWKIKRCVLGRSIPDIEYGT